MERVWLLTWTTYGAWLPGDDRGFVSNVRAGVGPEVKHNTPGTPCDAKQRGLALAARAQMKGDPVWLSSNLAEPLAAQFRETADFRGWSLLALAIMANHVHLVVGVRGDPEPETLLRDFKSYGSRCLSKLVGKPASGTWWTASGSRRKLPDERAVQAVIRYVQNQKYPLLVWAAENPASGGRESPDSLDSLFDAKTDPGADKNPGGEKNLESGG